MYVVTSMRNRGRFKVLTMYYFECVCPVHLLVGESFPRGEHLSTSVAVLGYIARPSTNQVISHPKTPRHRNMIGLYYSVNVSLNKCQGTIAHSPACMLCDPPKLAAWTTLCWLSLPWPRSAPPLSASLTHTARWMQELYFYHIHGLYFNVYALQCNIKLYLESSNN